MVYPLSVYIVRILDGNIKRKFRKKIRVCGKGFTDTD